MTRRLPGLALLAATLPLLAGCGGPGANGDAERETGERGSSLQARVEARLDSLDARTSAYARHLPSGREIAVRADRPMNALSVIKVAVMARAFADAEQGRLEMDGRHTVAPEDLRPGSGLLQTFRPGLRPTLRDLVTQMIITSDNTATDMVVERVGIDRVNRTLDTLGYEQTRLRMTTGDVFHRLWIREDSAFADSSRSSLMARGTPGGPDAARRAFAFEGDSTEWLGRMTAREVGHFLERIYRGELVSDSASEAMLGILRRQFYSSRLPRLLGPGVSVAHKTGDWPPHAGNDAGILLYDGGPSVVSVFVNQNRGEFVEVERAIGRIAADVVRTWNGPGDSRP